MKFLLQSLHLLKVHRNPNYTHYMLRNFDNTRNDSLGKGKGHPRTGHEGPEGEQMYSSTLPSTLVLDGCGWSTPRPSRFTPGKTRYPLYRRLGGPQGQSGRLRKILPLPGFDPQPIQSVASRYTDCAIVPPKE